jgi:hypothetical protein
MYLDAQTQIFWKIIIIRYLYAQTLDEDTTKDEAADKKRVDAIRAGTISLRACMHGIFQNKGKVLI